MRNIHRALQTHFKKQLLVKPAISSAMGMGSSGFLQKIVLTQFHF